MKVHVRGSVRVRGRDERRHSGGDDGVVGDEFRSERTELHRGPQTLHGVDGGQDVTSGLPLHEWFDGEFDPQHVVSVGREIGPSVPEHHHSRHRSVATTISPANSREHEGEAVGQKSFDAPGLLEFIPIDPPCVGHLTIGEHERSGVDHLETATHERNRVVVEAERSSAVEFEQLHSFDPDLLGQFTMRGHDVVLTDGHDSADGDVAPSRPDVLGRRSAMDEQASGTIGDRHEDGPVSQPSRPHVGPADAADHAIVLVDLIDHLIGSIRVHPVLLPSDHRIRTF